MANKIITKVLIGRAINGISINGLEYLLDENDNPMVFSYVSEAKCFLRENGYDVETASDELLDELFIFEEVTNG